MKQNESTVDQAIRIVTGLSLLIASTYYLTGVIQIFAAIFGIVSLFTGFTGFCALYSLFGINTIDKAKLSKKG